jgi:hypothetical protein
MGLLQPKTKLIPKPMKRILTVLIIVVWGSLQLFAQQGLITGKVIDETGEAMLGVNVTIQGTTTGTITNADGRFSLPGVATGNIIEFSFVGMETTTGRGHKPGPGDECHLSHQPDRIGRGGGGRLWGTEERRAWWEP